MVNVIDSPSVDTATQILDAAEQLFAVKGFNATSMRAITHKAEVNLAAVNYHFGSKDNLIFEVIKRGIQPINASRLKRLDALMDQQRADTAGSVSLPEVLDAFYRPAFEYFQDSSRIHFLRLLGRTLYETGPFTQQLLEKEWMPLVHRFLAGLKITLPHLEETEIMWRFHFAIGSMVFTVSQFEALEAMACEDCKIRDDFEPAIERLISFTAAGLAQPAPDQKGAA
ncbi:MAG: TetR/AcrR family transcriptional regulator [Verrucomicrobiota bacterium]